MEQQNRLCNKFIVVFICTLVAWYAFYSLILPNSILCIWKDKYQIALSNERQLGYFSYGPTFLQPSTSNAFEKYRDKKQQENNTVTHNPLFFTIRKKENVEPITPNSIDQHVNKELPTEREIATPESNLQPTTQPTRFISSVNQIETKSPVANNVKSSTETNSEEIHSTSLPPQTYLQSYSQNASVFQESLLNMNQLVAMEKKLNRKLHDYPSDHIPDERLVLFYPDISKSEYRVWKELSHEYGLSEQCERYKEFVQDLEKKKKPNVISHYQFSMEDMPSKGKVKGINIKKLVAVLDEKKNTYLLKKFKGNEEVQDIRTSANRIFYQFNIIIHS